MSATPTPQIRPLTRLRPEGRAHLATGHGAAPARSRTDRRRRLTRRGGRSAGMRLTLGSLFAGIGGFDLGFERAGIVTRWQAEIDPSCRDILARHVPDATRYADVREVNGA